MEVYQNTILSTRSSLHLMVAYSGNLLSRVIFSFRSISSRFSGCSYCSSASHVEAHTSWPTCDLWSTLWNWESIHETQQSSHKNNWANDVHWNQGDSFTMYDACNVEVISRWMQWLISIICCCDDDEAELATVNIHVISRYTLPRQSVKNRKIPLLG